MDTIELIRPGSVPTSVASEGSCLKKKKYREGWLSEDFFEEEIFKVIGNLKDK